jgi:hypothetical protein
MPIYERINVVVSLTLIGLALFFVLSFPVQEAEISLFGTPIEIVAPRQWLMMVLLAALAMAGTDVVIRMHPKLPSLYLTYRATFWMLPGLLVVLATQTLGLAPTPAIWAISLAIFGLMLWFTILAEYRQVSPDGVNLLWPRLWRQFIGYGVTLAFFIVIYQTRSRSAISATAVLLVSSSMALGLLCQPPEAILKSWLLAGVIGLGLGQMTWALNYWRIGALNAGLLLFLVFYLFVGLTQQYLDDKISHRTLWEFGTVAGVALIVIYNL